MATITKAITLFVLFSLFLLSQSLQDPSTSLSLSSSESGSESTTVVGSENQEPDRTVVFNPSDLDAPHVDPDLIAHSFRLPNHHRHHHRHVHHRHHADDGSIRMFRGFVGVRPRVEFPAEMKEFEPKEEMRRREDRDGDESDDEDEIEHKRMKRMMKRMKKMRRFRKEEEEEERGWGFVDRVRHFVNHLL